MDFVFHDDVLSLIFNVGSVFVWDSIKNLRCTKTSKPVQIIEHKPDEQPILNMEDTNIMLDDELNWNTVNNDVLIETTVTIKYAISEAEEKTLDTTTLVENNIDSDENNTLLNITIEEGNNFDIQNNTVELNIVASHETVMDDKNVILKDAIDEKSNLNIDENNVILEAAVSEETTLNVDNTNVVQEAAPEITPFSKSDHKEILLDVVELLDKMENKNVFLNNTHEQILRSNISKKIISFKKMIKNFTIRKSKKMEQKIPTVTTGRLKLNLTIPQSR
ncbi:hypothetical protein CDAR_28191 [Caerostris darwini]|uniref:Uncharacterized protein n=1 Tax=Caerostris darwini TaxID=1538125 RepID=A0AAV4VEV8_9ARAC|nr:hypothetical protein CDAR_28191 [Caerostris darwini]